MMARSRGAAAVACIWFICATPAIANDTAAELAIGGLQFARSANVEMDSEDLKISLERISVHYSFSNISAAPVTLTVAFPFPDIDLAEGEMIAFPSNDPVNFVDFETKVDGQPIKFGIEQRAFVGDKDVTSILAESKIALLPIGPRQFRAQDLPEPTRTKFAAEGLLMPAGTNERGRPMYGPGWIVKTSAVRKQTFPSGKPVSVEHSYRPSVGSSSDTILRKALRQAKAMAPEIDRYRREYCVTDEFLRKLDKVAGDGQANSAKVEERRINYVLKTGANWAGPIKDFRLSIDPGSNRLVSFCAGKLMPATKGALQFQAANFTPDRDLKVLIIGRF
jgi:hypothetical protein